MIASHRADEITFYEELGVAPGASSEEIRDAFRALARLLHPDQQTDAPLKATAEKQMRKLNRIYAVLSDPARRRQYDEALGREDGPAVVTGPRFRPGLMKAAQARGPRLQTQGETRAAWRPEGVRCAASFWRVAGRTAWAAAILCSAALLIWLASETTPEPQSRARDQNAAVSAAAPPLSKSAGGAGDQESLIAGLRSDLSTVTRQRDAAIHELRRLRRTATPVESTSPGGSETGAPAITITELPPAAEPPAVANYPLRVESTGIHKLDGFWFYAQPPQGQQYRSHGRYPPEYIEATISEQNGTIQGKYHARFRIVNRAISPDVNFTFAGISGASPQTTFPWTGSDGAKGEVTLRFTSVNSLRIDWKATEPGNRQGLDADTAILTRRIP